LIRDKRASEYALHAQLYWTDNQILSLYAKGMSTRDIVSTFKEMYDADGLFDDLLVLSNLDNNTV
jgi:transposase-like protein